MSKKEGNTIIQIEVPQEVGAKIRQVARAKGMIRQRFYEECLMDGFKNRSVSEVEQIAMAEMKKFAIRAKKMKKIKEKEKENEKRDGITQVEIDELVKSINELVKVINAI